MTVAVGTQGAFNYQAPEAVLAGSPLLTEFARYDVSEDASRFLIVKEIDTSDLWPRIVMVQNWFDELERLVPTN